jgi:erythromycin esterase-like protein
VFRQLTERLKTYAPAPTGFDLNKWMDDISPLANGCNPYHPNDQVRIDKAIQDLQQWIDIAAPEAQKRFPQVPHATAMSLITENLRAARQFCADMAADPEHNYGLHRDTIAPQYTVELKAAIPGQKLMLWAHINHLYHDVEHRNTSTGEYLHRALGTRLYTIGIFPEHGGAIVIFPGDGKDNEDIGYTRVHSDQGPLAERLRNLSAQDYFLDFRDTGISAGNDPVFVSPQPIWFEGQNLSLAVARDFDGIVWIKNVHAADFPIVLFLVLSGKHYIPELIVFGVLFIFGIVFLVVRGIRGRRRKRAA